MHHIHTTPGFILNARPRGEADKMLSVFTRDFGLVTAIAQGIRLERSKLRYHAQEYSFGIFSLVRGKEFWRLISATPCTDDPSFRFGSLVSAHASAYRKELIVKIAALLKRLLQGEEAHPEILEAVKAANNAMDGHPDLDEEELAALESLTVARILHWLGYIGDDGELKVWMDSFEIKPGSLEGLKGKRAVLNRHINRALKESHL